MKTHVLVLGGGTGGISVAARLLRLRSDLQVSIVEPSCFHYYQAFWTLVGGGVGAKESTERPMAEVIPRGATWIQDSVLRVHPEDQWVELKTRRVKYDYLIVATGLKLNWEAVDGLTQSIGKNGVCSIYD